MKIVEFATWGSISDFISGKPADREISHDYEGPVAKLDRWAQGAEKNLVGTAKDTAATAGGLAASEEAPLRTFANQEMNAQHLYDPTQVNTLLTAAEAPLGAEAAATEGAAQRESALTNNASGFAKDLDLAARTRAKTAAGAGEQIAAEDIRGAQELRQRGAGLMGELFKTDTQKQLEAMGIQNQATQGEVEAGKSGWLQNFDNTLAAVTGSAKNLAPPA